MFANIPNPVDAQTTAEALEQMAHDPAVATEQAGAFAQAAVFLRGIHGARCSRCHAHIGSPSQWALQLAKAASDERSSAMGCRNIMRDVERRTRGFCSKSCEDGTAQNAY